jgi:uncharacterized membrane protein (DUF2068 family)
MTRHESAPSRWLGLLAAAKVVEGIVLCLVAFELFELIDPDVEAFIERWVVRLHVDPHNPIIAAALGRARGIGPATLEEYAGISGAFGSVSVLQGVGLWLRQGWAESLCALSTAVFIPLEIHELIEDPHVASAGALLVNAAIVAYLVRRIRGRRPARSSART